MFNTPALLSNFDTGKSQGGTRLILCATTPNVVNLKMFQITASSQSYKLCENGVLNDKKTEVK